MKDALVTATKMGSPIVTAAEYAGVGARPFQRWLARGRDAHEARTDPETPAPPDPADDPYVELWLEIEQARTVASVAAVATLRRAMEGGAVTEETTRRYRDENGQTVTETTTKRTAPDWRAAAFLLERRDPEHFGKQTQVAVTGKDGGPLQVVDVNKMAESIRLSMAGVQAAIEAPADPDIVDAEILDD